MSGIDAPLAGPGGVDDQGHVASGQELEQVIGRIHLQAGLLDVRQSGFPQRRPRARRRQQAIAEPGQGARDGYDIRLVLVAHPDEHRPARAQAVGGGDLRFQEGFGEGAAPAHHLAGGFHLRPQHEIGAGEPGEGKHRFLHRIGYQGHCPQPLRLQRPPDHDPGCLLGQRHAGRLADEGYGARGARIDLQQKYLLPLDRELRVHQSHDAQLQRQGDRLPVDFGLNRARKAMGWQGARAIPRVHAGVLDVFHHARDHCPGAVCQHIDIHLDRVGQELIDQYRVLGRGQHGRAEIARKLILAVDDLHGPPAQHVRGPHHERIADAGSGGIGFGQGCGTVVRRLVQAELFHQLREAPTILRAVYTVIRCTEHGYAGCFETLGQLERRLPAQLNHHPVRLLQGHDLQHVLQGDRLEVESVRDVVIGTDRLRVAVDHDRLPARLPQCQRGMHAAVVELDALSDAIGPAAQDQRLLPLAALRLIIFLVGRVKIGRGGLELRRARIHLLVYWANPQVLAPLAQRILGTTDQAGQARVGEAPGFPPPQIARRQILKPRLADDGLFLDELANLRDEPGVDIRQLRQPAIAPAQAHGVRQAANAFRRRVGQAVLQIGLQRVRRNAFGYCLVQPGQPGFQRPQRLLKRFLEHPPAGHHFANRLHLGGQPWIGQWKFFEGEAGDLGHHVIH